MWNDLGLIDKSRIMELAVKSGIKDLRTIEEVYNYASGGELHRFDDGGPKETLMKYKGTNNDPLQFDIWTSNPEKAESFLINRNIRESEVAPEVAEFFRSYASSNGIDRIIKNQKEWYKKYHPIRKIVPGAAYDATSEARRLKKALPNINTNGVFDVDIYSNASGLTYKRSDPSKNITIIGTLNDTWPRGATVAHEMMHKYNYTGLSQGEALDQNTNGANEHDKRREEKHSDIEALKWILFDKGIYDVRGDVDATADDIRKLREVLKAEGKDFRSLEQMTDEQAAWMINHVADVSEKISTANLAALGGKIHIKPQNRGKFTALKERTGHSASWFKEHGTPAQKKMAVFALNARKWKHEDGGPLVNLLGEGGPTGNTKETKTYYTPTYKKLPKTYKQGVTEVAQEMNIPEGEVPLYYDTGMLRPALGLREYPNNGRRRDNDSPTQELSEFYERQMNNQIYRGKEGRKPNMPYAIPYLDEKEIKVKGVGRVSTNALDSLAKYAGIVGLPLEEALGLAAQETQFGAIPYYNMGQEGVDARALGNTSYFRNYGVIPAENFVRDFRYNKADWKGEYIDQSKPPLQHAFEYYKKGDYNRGDPNHTSDVKKRGKALMTDSNIIKWMQTSPFVKKK